MTLACECERFTAHGLLGYRAWMKRLPFYRSVLLRKLKLNTWDGTNETVEACLEAGETLTDTGGNNVTVQATGTLPLPVQELLPVPVGVAVVRY